VRFYNEQHKIEDSITKLKNEIDDEKKPSEIAESISEFIKLEFKKLFLEEK
jgi:hypothetical protein